MNQTSDHILRTIAELFIGKHQDKVQSTARDVLRLLVIHNIVGLDDDSRVQLTEKGQTLPVIGK